MSERDHINYQIQARRNPSETWKWKKTYERVSRSDLIGDTLVYNTRQLTHRCTHLCHDTRAALVTISIVNGALVRGDCLAFAITPSLNTIQRARLLRTVYTSEQLFCTARRPRHFCTETKLWPMKGSSYMHAHVHVCIISKFCALNPQRGPCLVLCMWCDTVMSVFS